MSVTTKKTVATSLSPEEIEELDRIRERQNLSRSQALRQAVRWYVGAMRRLPSAEEPLPDEIEALREAEEEFSRGGGRPLRDALRDLDRCRKRSG
jgi:metal-responsive CopG/Arc/MetJ family transcriptional regulator